ncbi:MAG: acyltransferase family protein [Pseudomonadota bacterium]
MNRMNPAEGLAHPESGLPPTRYHYMDNLRALAMLAGIFFHAALAYSPMLNQLWLSASSETSAAMDFFAWFSHLFRMPLFFLIAGFFTCYLVGKRGIGGLLKNRALRILVPFVVFLPLVWITIGTGIEWAMANVEQKSPLLNVFAYMASMPDAPPPPVTTTHLWFLYNLCQFYLVYAVLERTGVLKARWAGVLADPRFLIFVLPLLILPALATQPSPHPAPEQFTPKLWAFGFYGLFFLVGAQLFRQPARIDALRPWAPWLLVSSLGLYAGFYALLPKSISLEAAMASQQAGVTMTLGHVGTAALGAIVAVHMTLVCLVAGRIFMDRANPIVRFIADSSYWVYIIHLPLLFGIQYWLLDSTLGMWSQFAVSSFGTLAIGILTYTVFVRWTPLGWLLHGRRKQGSRPQSTAAAAGDVAQEIGA